MEKDSAFLVVGKKLPRVDAIAKATGQAKYSVDLELPGMLHGKILRSPHPHAKIVRIDTSEAEKLPGVKAILTFKDIPKVKFNPSTRYNFPPLPEDAYILADKARFVGDEIAAVAAESEEIAEEALSLIKVEYEKLPAVFDPEEAMKPGAPKIHDWADNNIVARISVNQGDVEKGFKEADLILEDEFKVQPQHHCALEPHACVAHYTSEGLTIWSSTQVPFQVRNLVAKILDLPIHKVRVIKPHVGGGFGGKDEMFHEALAALLSKRTGRPVKIELTRAEVFSATRTRHSGKERVKIGFKKDGTIVALHLETIFNAGAYSAASPRITRANGVRALGLYRLPNYRFDGYCVYTNVVPAGAFRGYGNPQQGFAIEQMLDMAAEKLGIDPIEIRLKNVVRVGDPNPLTKGIFESVGIADCIKKGAELIGWQRRKPKIISNTKRRGYGMAIAAHWTSVAPYAQEYVGAVVNINPDGTINLMVGASDIGQGSDTVMCQIAAEILGLSLSDVSIIAADTAVTPWDAGSYSSKTTHIAGNAVRLAAIDAKNKLLTEAAKILKVDKEELECKDKKVFLKSDPSKSVSVPEIINWMKLNSEEPWIIGKGVYKMITNCPTYLAHFVELSVDIQTGSVEVLKFVACQDVGVAINPLQVEGQMEGSIHMGMGYALTEGIIFDKETGKVLNNSFVDYKLIPPKDMPEEIITELIPTYEPTGPFGAKGCSEVGMTPVAPAIANAIYDAIGIRIKELPMSKERVLTTFKRKNLK
jgi:xanthine dehydrogenase molybdenum-binding subunit